MITIGMINLDDRIRNIIGTEIRCNAKLFGGLSSFLESDSIPAGPIFIQATNGWKNRSEEIKKKASGPVVIIGNSHDQRAAQSAGFEFIRAASVTAHEIKPFIK